MAETPFVRLTLDPEEVRRSQADRRASGRPHPAEGLRPIVRFSAAHGCAAFGRLDATNVRVGGPVEETLRRTYEAAIATQSALGFRLICLVDPPALDPWVVHQSAALRSADGRYGLLVQYYRRERAEDLAYACTSALPDGSTVLTRREPPGPFDPPTFRVAAPPSGSLKDILDLHAARIAELPVVPYAEDDVPRVILELNRQSFDHSLAAGHFVPLAAHELAMIRSSLRGDLLRGLLERPGTRAIPADPLLRNTLLWVVMPSACAGFLLGIAGLVLGRLAPEAVLDFYLRLDPYPPSAFDPASWAARRGFDVGLLVGAAGGLVAWLAGWLWPLRRRSASSEVIAPVDNPEEVRQ